MEDKEAQEKSEEEYRGKVNQRYGSKGKKYQKKKKETKKKENRKEKKKHSPFRTHELIASTYYVS